MTTYTTKSTEITAEQWDASDDALHRIQRLIFPASPLVARREDMFSEDEKYRTVMIVASRPDTVTKQEMVRCGVGDWVVKWPDGQIDVVGGERFRALYAPAVSKLSPSEIAEKMGVPSLADF